MILKKKKCFECQVVVVKNFFLTCLKCSVLVLWGRTADTTSAFVSHAVSRRSAKVSRRWWGLIPRSARIPSPLRVQRSGERIFTRSYMYMGIYVCIYAQLSVPTHERTYTDTYVIRSRIHINVHGQIHTRTHPSTFAYTPTRRHTHTQTNT